MKHARGEKVARSTVIYDEAGSVIETHAREGNFKETKFNGKISDFCGKEPVATNCEGESQDSRGLTWYDVHDQHGSEKPPLRTGECSHLLPKNFNAEFSILSRKKCMFMKFPA
jgi:hypothetical protein